MDKKNRIIIGLTGGIASGKSVVTEHFFRLGCHVVDLDVISRKVTAFGTAGHDKLLKVFPDVAVDGVICRSKLRERVFGDLLDMNILSAIVQPLIVENAIEELEKLTNGVIIFAAPLLFETGLEKMVDLTVSVSSNEDLRIQRLIKRDNITRALALKMICSQMNDNQRNMISDYVIINDGTCEELYSKVESLYSIFKERIDSF